MMLTIKVFKRSTKWALKNDIFCQNLTGDIKETSGDNNKYLFIQSVFICCQQWYTELQFTYSRVLNKIGANLSIGTPECDIRNTIVHTI